MGKVSKPLSNNSEVCYNIIRNYLHPFLTGLIQILRPSLESPLSTECFYAQYLESD